ncbi:phage tail protein, partial [Escherichia coli]
VQLSSAINSTSEILAATPKAVKAAYDLANGKQPADATLTALAGLATAADRLPYFTGADRAALATLTAIGRAIIAKGSIKDVLNYLGLGEAAKRNVGTGTNQIPDMGSFTLSVSGTGYQKLPSGFILQWGSIGAPGIAQDVVTHFPIAFPNRCLRVLVSQDYTPDSGAVGYIACAGFSPDPVKFISRASTPGLGASFLALGC